MTGVDIHHPALHIKVEPASHDHLRRGRRHLLTLPPGDAPTRFGFRLNSGTVAASIPSRVPGSYILLARGSVTYVGRSDRCLRTRLMTHPLRGTATHFCATVADSPRQAYLLESYWWHRYTRDGTSLDNRIHPAAPEARTSCPFCGYAAATTIPTADRQTADRRTAAAIAVANN